MKAQLKMVNAYGEVVEYKEIDTNGSSIDKAAMMYRYTNPDLWVTITSLEPGDDSFSALMPENMRKDELLVEQEEMDFKAYMSKWYPGNKSEDVLQELDSDTLDGAMFSDLEDYDLNFDL